jgi:hypothetical protein
LVCGNGSGGGRAAGLLSDGEGSNKLHPAVPTWAARVAQITEQFDSIIEHAVGVAVCLPTRESGHTSGVVQFQRAAKVTKLRGFEIVGSRVKSPIKMFKLFHAHS